MPEDDAPKGLSREAWGAITAITVAVISGAVTLVMHFWGPDDAGAGAREAPNAPAITADSIAGRWAGTAAAEGGAPFRVEVEIAPGCVPGARCGIIAVSNLPCYGTLYLHTIDRGDYEFRVDDFTASSAKGCQPGAGEHLRRLPDGTLQYTTSYGPRGVLAKQ